MLLLIIPLSGCGTSTVTVNNDPIPDSEINQMMKAQEALMGDVSDDQEKALRENIINNLINQNLLIQEAQKRDIKVSDKDIETKYDETLKNWKAGGELQKSLKAQGFTDSNMKEMIKDQLLIQGLSDSLITVNEEQLENYFKEHSYEYNTYTSKKAEGSTNIDASEKLDSAKESILSYYEFPLQLQQSIQANKLPFNVPQISKLNDKSYQALEITAINKQSFEDVQEQVKQAYKTQVETAKVQELLSSLKTQATIKRK